MYTCIRLWGIRVRTGLNACSLERDIAGTRPYRPECFIAPSPTASIPTVLTSLI